MASQVAIDALRRYGTPDEHPDGGACRDCSHCVTCCFDEAQGDRLRDELTARYGVCNECPDEPVLVPLDQWHDWDDCWTGAA